MTPYYTDPWLTVYLGDCRAVMAQMEPESVHCVVTSPPYWGLRDYGAAGQLGLESTPEEYVANMVAVFREVRRVLRSDGTVWLNLGDSYASDMKGSGGPTPKQASNTGSFYEPRRLQHGLKPKDLVGIPWRVAFALQQPYYTGNIKAETDRTWLAALVDGEGTFTILSTTSPHGSGNSYPPIAQVRMTSERVVQKAASLVGVASPAQYPPSNRGNRAVYQWRLSGRRAADVARELYPYLLEKRKQAMVVWNHQVVRDSYETKRGVTIPTAAVAQQQVCRDIIRRLNHGEDVDLPSWMVEPPSLYEPGWYLRSDVIWSKPNPMPESVTDRPTKSHEYLFLLSKAKTYYFDGEAVRLPVSPNWERGAGAPMPELGDHRREDGARGHQAQRTYDVAKGANIRTVWTIATQPYPGAHFATFPRALVEPCIKAASSEKGVCPECGAPWVREVERTKGDEEAFGRPKHLQSSRSTLSLSGNGSKEWAERGSTAATTGWRPSCGDVIEAAEGGYETTRPHTPVPATILDPFAGSGTTGMVAQSLSRRAVLIDLNVDYLTQVMDRNRDIPLGLDVA